MCVLRKQGMDLKMGQARRVQAKTQTLHQHETQAVTSFSLRIRRRAASETVSYANKDEGLNRLVQYLYRKNEKHSFYSRTRKVLRS